MTLFERIIEEVKKYPCLWNKSLDSYRNQNARDNAWKMISLALNTPGIDVRKKWASLRDCFRRELAQQQQQRKTTSKLCTKMRRKYLYFNQLKFLLPHVKVSTTPKSSLLESEISEAPPEAPTALDGENEHSSTEENAEASTACSCIKNKREENYGEEILELLKEATKNRFDNDEYFLLSLAPKFKRYDTNKRCLLRLEILNTILKFHQQHMPTTKS
ncbi:Transcription factor Adf-1 [Armadillidium nasatum]|uniref:Transcription factor Adf-1 n=1 Tax=Armadillidium nasatum TaxID=96803 RepID=A0A5N5T498_9CRUS|nr:Transcription factor Adf-1 [Armadillidium nasatum]